VTLDTLVYTFNLGPTPEEIVQQYPALDLASVFAGIAYYLRVFEVNLRVSFAKTIDDLRIPIECRKDDECEGQICFIPLNRLCLTFDWQIGAQSTSIFALQLVLAPGNVRLRR